MTAKVKELAATLRPWRLPLPEPFVIGSLFLVLIYLSWTSDRVLLYVVLGLLMMGFSFIMPFRKVDAPTELRWDLFALLTTLMVFLPIFEFAFEKPSVGYLMHVGWIHRFHEWVTQWPLGLAIACNYIFSDFVAYWTHRVLHGRWLWSSHAFHHSAKNLNWISGSRATLIHNVALFLPYSVVWVFFPIPKAGMIATAFVIFDLANQHYLHSNIRLPFQRQLEWLFVTPRFHFVHHSACQKRTDSNFGLVFSVWDRLFGTYTDPESVDSADPLGIDYEISNWRLILGLPRIR